MKSSTVPVQTESALMTSATSFQEEDISKQLIHLTEKKKINYACFFQSAKHDKNINKEEIAAHVTWAYENIYALAYPGLPEDETYELARYFHGIQHVSRAALYIPVFANLYRRYGDKEALSLTEEELNLIQIAALFHDAGREGDGEDLWDTDSALLLYFYLILVLQIDKGKAIPFAEAVANKDANKKNYLELIYDKDAHQLVWKNACGRSKNIYQRLIHDVDCLDIIRARPHFDATYLDFYQRYVQLGSRAFKELAHLIMEARYIITCQGDAPTKRSTYLKKQYEHSQAYRTQVTLINRQKKYLRIIFPLYAEGKLLTESQLEQSLLAIKAYSLTEGPTDSLGEIIQSAIQSGNVLARGVPFPSAYRGKKAMKDMPDETLTEVEIRKAYRRLGVPTNTQKSNNKMKKGNPARSVSLIGWGGTVFASAGFLICSPSFSAMRRISSIDIDSGFGKKKSSLEKHPLSPTPEKTKKQFKELLHQQMMGGSSTYFPNMKAYATHTEIEYDITEFNAIYYTEDPVFSNHYTFPHRGSGLLQAIFLKKIFAKMQGKQLPIIHYSSHCICPDCLEPQHDFDFDDNKLIQLWVTLCSDYMQKQIKNNNLWFFSASLNDLKVMSMYSGLTFYSNKKIAPADSCYPETLRHEINLAIEKKRASLIEQHKVVILLEIMENCKDDTLSFIGFILGNTDFYLTLMNFPSLLKKKIVKVQLMHEMKRYLFFYQCIRDKESADKTRNYLFDFEKIRNVKEGIIAESTVNKENLQTYFYGEDIVLIYHLAILTRYTYIVETVKADAIVQAKYQFAVLIKKISKDINLADLWQDTNNIFKFCHIFRIFEEVKEVTYNFISYLFTAATKESVMQIRSILASISTIAVNRLFMRKDGKNLREELKGAYNNITFHSLTPPAEQHASSSLDENKLIDSPPNKITHVAARQLIRPWDSIYMAYSHRLLRERNVVSAFICPAIYVGSDGRQVSPKAEMDLLSYIEDKSILKLSTDNRLILVRQIMGQIILAIESLHDNNLVHSDIAPKNFLVMRDKQRLLIQLADLDNIVAVHPQNNNFMKAINLPCTAAGTFEYYPPEYKKCCTINEKNERVSITHFFEDDYSNLDLKAVDCYSVGETFSDIKDYLLGEHFQNEPLTALIEGLANKQVSTRWTIAKAKTSQFFGETEEDRKLFFSTLEHTWPAGVSINHFYLNAHAPNVKEGLYLLPDDLQEIYLQAEKLANEADSLSWNPDNKAINSCIHKNADQLILLIEKWLQAMPQDDATGKELITLKNVAENLRETTSPLLSNSICTSPAESKTETLSEDHKETLLKIIQDSVAAFQNNLHHTPCIIRLFSPHGTKGLKRGEKLLADAKREGNTAAEIFAIIQQALSKKTDGGTWVHSLKTILKNKLTDVYPLAEWIKLLEQEASTVATPPSLRSG